MKNKKLVLVIALSIIGKVVLGQNVFFHKSFPRILQSRNILLSIYNDGLQFQGEKKYTEAIFMLDSVINNYPSFYDASYHRFQINIKLKNYKYALRDIERVYEFKEKDSKYFFNKAKCYDKLNKSELAHLYYEMGLLFEPYNEVQLVKNANLYMYDKQFSKAVYYFDRVLNMSPGLYDIYYSRGIAKHNMKLYEEACQDWYNAYLENESCKKMHFYKCSKYKSKRRKTNLTKPDRIELPLFSHDQYNSLEEFITEKLIYPDVSLRNQEKGTVLVQFTVGKDSLISGIKILNGVSKSIDQEAKRLVKLTERSWLPAQKAYKSLDYTCILPIKFKIYDGYLKEAELYKQLETTDKSEYESLIHVGTNILRKNPFHLETYSILQELLKKTDYRETGFNYNYLGNLPKKNFSFLPEITSPASYCKMYFNDKWKICDKESAQYYRVINWSNIHNYPEGKVYNYYMSDSLFMVGKYHNLHKEGKFSFYYPNGNLSKTIYFMGNNPINEYCEYYENGVVKVNMIINDDFVFKRAN